MVTNANEHRVWLNNVLVPNQQNVSLSFSNSLVEVTRGRTNGYREVITGQRSGVVSIDAILDSNDLNRYETGALTTLRYGIDSYSFNADARITSIEMNGGTDTTVNVTINVETTDAIVEFRTLTLTELCTDVGQTICDSFGEPICVLFEVAVVQVELCTDLDQPICDNEGNIICINVLNTINQ